MSLEPSAPPTDRRAFFKGALCVCLGGVAALAPFGAGLMVLADPLRRGGGKVEAVRVATLEALPADGSPRKFPVLTDKTDAWNHYQNEPVGAVYLRRTGERAVEALNVACPHAGCFVDFSPGRAQFVCPCHNSSFKLTGAIADPKSPSPRALDSLPVEVRADGSIWVTFQNFEAGRAGKVPVA